MTVVINGTTGITSVNGSAAAPSVTGTDTDTGIVYGTNTLSMATGGTTALTANSAQGIQVLNTIGVGNTTPSTSGAGITFPATQSASSDANTLDDYEEGTWTPTQGAGLTVVGSFSSSGRYIKIGKQVTVQFNINGSTSVACAAANVICTGLPFEGDYRLYVGALTDSNNSNLGVNLQYGTGIYSSTAISARLSFVGSLTYFTA